MKILHIAFNDIRVILKEKTVILWWLALPLVFVFIFGNIIGDPSQDGTWLPVIKMDEHELADIFIEQLKGEKYWIDVKPASDEQYVPNWYQTLIIPQDFSQSILDGEEVNLTLTQGQGSPDKQLAAQTLLIRALIDFNGAIAATDITQNGWNDTTRQNLTDALAAPSPLTIETKEHFSLRPPPSGAAFTLPAYLVLFVMTNTIMFGGITMAYERSTRRITRLAATPVSPIEIFIGKMLGRMLQPIIQGVLLLIAGLILFKITLGDHPLALIPVLLSFAFCCGALGLLFGVFFHTEQQISGIGILTSTLLGALGGCWWPLEFAPPIFKTIAKFTPTYWAVHGLQDVMTFGKSFAGIIPECAILLLFGAVIIAITIPRFRWE